LIDEATILFIEEMLELDDFSPIGGGGPMDYEFLVEGAEFCMVESQNSDQVVFLLKYDVTGGRHRNTKRSAVGALVPLVLETTVERFVWGEGLKGCI
jgi:hypothetical protein